MTSNSLILFTGYVCNYNCSYCAQKLNKALLGNKNDTINTINNLLLKTVDKLCSTLFINEKFMNVYNNSLEIIGGEPTLIDLYSVIDKLINNKNYIKNLKIITNFSKENDYYLNLIKKLNNTNMNAEFIFSFHDEYISLEDFTEKIKSLSYDLNFIDKNKINLFTKMVVTNKHDINYLKKFLSISENTLFNSSIVPVYRPAKEGKYVYTYITDLKEELYNFILYRSLRNKKAENRIKILELFKALKKEGNCLSKENSIVLPNLWIKYDGTINYPCRTINNLNIDNVKLENIYTNCNNIKCNNFNECREVNIDNNS